MLFIPNIPNKMILLVDDLTPNNKMGIATDPFKFDYNIDQMHADVRNNINMRLPLVEDKMVTITTIGRYILIFELDKSTDKRAMIFFDYEPEVSLESIESSLMKQFSKNIALEFIRLQRELSSNFSKEMDTVHLHYIDESLDDINMN